MTIVDTSRPVTGGVDTHLEVNVAAALDRIGGLLGVESFPTTVEGNHRLLEWMEGFGSVARVGVEGTGSYGAPLARLLREVGVEIAPFAEARDRLDTITGVGKRAAECIIAEIGTDMGRFPTAAHLASWAGMCPDNNITGGKRRSGKTNKGNRWLGELLPECAWAAAHARNTYLGAQFWRLARRIGKTKAAVAVGHSILVIAWHLLSRDVDYEDLGGDWFTLGTDPQRRKAALINQLQALGYAVTLRPAA